MGEGGGVVEIAGQALHRKNPVRAWPNNYVVLFRGRPGERQADGGIAGISADGEAAELGLVAGLTTISDKAIVDWLKHYTTHAPHYSVIHNNCQHFVEAFCKHAVGPAF